MRLIIKKILTFWLIIYFAICVPTAYASFSPSTTPGGWGLTGFNVATSVMSAVKAGSSSVATVARSVSVANIAKGVAAGGVAAVGGGLAFQALTGVALDAVDWVLDPANNQIKYKERASGADAPCPAYGGTYLNVSSGITVTRWVTYDDASKTTGTMTCAYKDGYGYTHNISYKFGAVAYKTLSYDTLANKVVDNAIAGTDSAAAAAVEAAAVEAAAVEYAKTGALDNTFDANAKPTTACPTGQHYSGTACVADITDTPNTSAPPNDVPVPPFDPSSVIAAIQSLGAILTAVLTNVLNNIKALPTVINTAIDKVTQKLDGIASNLSSVITNGLNAVKQSVDSLKDWASSDPDPQTDSKPDIDTTTPTKSAQDFDSNYINFGGQCPSFSPTTISVGMVAVPISFNAEPLCDFAILCRPIILALAYFAAMAIVANAIRSE